MVKNPDFPIVWEGLKGGPSPGGGLFRGDRVGSAPEPAPIPRASMWLSTDPVISGIFFLHPRWIYDG